MATGGTSSGGPFNLLTALILTLTALFAAGFVLALFFPAIVPGVVAPPSAPAVASLPSSTPPPPTKVSSLPTLPPAWTNTPVPTSTDTPPPTDTPLPTATRTPTNTRPPTGSPTPSRTPAPTRTAFPTKTPLSSGGTGTGSSGSSGAPPAIPAIVNPSFESAYTTDEQGNHHPDGWVFYSPANGEYLPYPTKAQVGVLVDAVSGGPGQYLHINAAGVPLDEVPGQPRAIILEGSNTFKITGPAAPHALRLSQTLRGTPGLKARVTVYILGETYDQPNPSVGYLEGDHFVASLSLGEALDVRIHSDMKQRFEVAGNTRPWNRFVVEAVFPATGQLDLVIICQQNWPGNTVFYIDYLSVEVVP